MQFSQTSPNPPSRLSASPNHFQAISNSAARNFQQPQQIVSPVLFSQQPRSPIMLRDVDYERSQEQEQRIFSQQKDIYNLKEQVQKLVNIQKFQLISHQTTLNSFHVDQSSKHEGQKNAYLEEIKRLSELLKERNNESLKYKSYFEQQQQNVQTFQNIDQDVKRQKQLYDQKSLELEESKKQFYLLSSQLSIKGIQIDDLEKQVNDKTRENFAQEAQIQKITQREQETVQNLQRSAANEKEILNKKIEQLQSDQADLQAQNREAESQLAKLREIQTAQLILNNTLKQQNNSLKAETQEQSLSIETLNERISQLEPLKQQLAAAQQKNASLQTQIEAKGASIVNLKQENQVLTEKENKLELQVQTIEQTLSQNQHIQKQLLESQTENSQLNIKTENLGLEIRRKEVEIEQLKIKNQELLDLQPKFAQIQQRADNLAQQLQSLVQEKEAQRQQIVEQTQSLLQMKLIQNQNKLLSQVKENLEKEVQNLNETSHQQILQIKGLEQAQTLSLAEINDLNQKLIQYLNKIAQNEQFSRINENRIRQYKSVEEALKQQLLDQSNTFKKEALKMQNLQNINQNRIKQYNSLDESLNQRLFETTKSYKAALLRIDGYKKEKLVQDNRINQFLALESSLCQTIYELKGVITSQKQSISQLELANALLTNQIVLLAQKISSLTKEINISKNRITRFQELEADLRQQQFNEKVFYQGVIQEFQLLKEQSEEKIGEIELVMFELQNDYNQLLESSQNSKKFQETFEIELKSKQNQIKWQIEQIEKLESQQPEAVQGLLREKEQLMAQRESLTDQNIKLKQKYQEISYLNRDFEKFKDSYVLLSVLCQSQDEQVSTLIKDFESQRKEKLLEARGQ